jgi:hypothetical protein
MNADDLQIIDDDAIFYVNADDVLKLIQENRQQNAEIEALKDKLHNVIISSAKRVNELEVSLQEALDEAEMWENNYKSIT